MFERHVIIVKPSFKYLGVLLGHLSVNKCYAPVPANMLARARMVSSLSLGMQGCTYLIAAWVAPVINVAARVCMP